MKDSISVFHEPLYKNPKGHIRLPYCKCIDRQCFIFELFGLLLDNAGLKGIDFFLFTKYTVHFSYTTSCSFLKISETCSLKGI